MKSNNNQMGFPIKKYICPLYYRLRNLLLSSRKSMSLTIGFYAEEGIVLGADTRIILDINNGTHEDNIQKIYELSDNVAIVYGGTVGVMMNIIERIKSSLNKTNKDNPKNIIDLITNEIKDYYKRTLSEDYLTNSQNIDLSIILGMYCNNKPYIYNILARESGKVEERLIEEKIGNGYIDFPNNSDSYWINYFSNRKADGNDMYSIIKMIRDSIRELSKTYFTISSTSQFAIIYKEGVFRELGREEIEGY